MKEKPTLDPRHVPVPLRDLAEELATPSKSAKAWLEELRKARHAGTLKITKRNGRKGGNVYCTRYFLEKYLGNAYRVMEGGYCDARR